jgi:hypothetical protein
MKYMNTIFSLSKKSLVLGLLIGFVWSGTACADKVCCRYWDNFTDGGGWHYKWVNSEKTCKTVSGDVVPDISCKMK